MDLFGLPVAGSVTTATEPATSSNCLKENPLRPSGGAEGRRKQASNENDVDEPMV
jgi:hypothetical protein